VWIQVADEDHRDALLVKIERSRRCGEKEIKRRMQTKQIQMESETLYEASLMTTGR
jgi:hypothetical protein